MCQEHDCLQEQIGHADENLVFLDMLINAKINAAGLKLVLHQRRGHVMRRVTVVLTALADRRKLIPFAILRRKNLPKGRLPS
jgi:hypothetical protein